MVKEGRKACLKESEEPVFRVHITDPKSGTDKVVWLSESLLAVLEGTRERIKKRKI